MSDGLKDGVLLIDKPSGMTSHDVVARARKAFRTKAIGHAGTLDPLASGLLVLLLGEGTKLSNYLLNEQKGYFVEVQLGVETDTLDMDGTVLKTTPVDVTQEAVIQAVMSLQGDLNLAVPIYSAVKQNGRKLYEMARREDEITCVPQRRMRFFDLQIASIEKDRVGVRLRCSKGSFVRSWAAELGRLLGVGGCVKTLRRTESIPYRLEQAGSFDWLSADQTPEEILSRFQQAWIPLERCLPHWPSVRVEGRDEKLLQNGQISHRLHHLLCSYYRVPTEAGASILERGVKMLSRRSGQLLALVASERDRDFRIRRVFKAGNPSNS